MGFNCHCTIDCEEFVDVTFVQGPVQMVGEDLSNSVTWSAHDFKFPADQGFAVARNHYGICLPNGEDVSRDLNGVALYFKLAADQGDVIPQNECGICRSDGVQNPVCHKMNVMFNAPLPTEKTE
jgi:hypothetical protein